MEIQIAINLSTALFSLFFFPPFPFPPFLPPFLPLLLLSFCKKSVK
jgi:hypothetical protein